MIAAVCTASLPTGGWVLVDGGEWGGVGGCLDILGDAGVVVARLVLLTEPEPVWRVLSVTGCWSAVQWCQVLQCVLLL